MGGALDFVLQCRIIGEPSHVSIPSLSPRLHDSLSTLSIFKRVPDIQQVLKVLVSIMLAIITIIVENRNKYTGNLINQSQYLCLIFRENHKGVIILRDLEQTLNGGSDASCLGG